MDDAPILNHPWPPNLNPADVPFRSRTVTILRRKGFFGDPTRFDTLTEAEVMSWWSAGVETVDDIRRTGNDAIRRHQPAGPIAT